jgi:prepilin-type N-terminal cleavage/methylation domain-containing protein
MNPKLKTSKMQGDKGLTLIELLVAMVISAILIAAIYRTFIGQQKIYMVQEQVADMHQNARVAINRMMREIRMTGFGNVRDVLDLEGGVNGFTEVIIPNGNSITIIGGFRQISTLAADAAVGQNTITLASASDASEFDINRGTHHRYISIGGLESNTVQSVTGAVLTLDSNHPLKLTHPEGTPIFKIHAIRYGVRKDDNGVYVLFRDLYPETASSQRDTVAEDIENVQFEYFDGDGKPTATVKDIRMVRVTVTARTRIPDIEIRKEGKLVKEEYRRRTISSNILFRNMGVNP